MSKRNWKRAILAALALAATATSIGGGQVAVAGTCPTRTTTKPFTAWGDSNDYFVVPGATFEGSHGWRFSGAVSVVADQEPWKINGSSHSKSLNLPAYTTAIAPNMCIASNEDSLRLFYKDPGKPGASLLVKVEAWNTGDVTARSVVTNTIDSRGAGWKLTPRIALPNKRDAAGEQWVTITITPVNTGATWRVDDVMLDPWISR
jgi:hypothetical protein